MHTKFIPVLIILSTVTFSWGQSDTSSLVTPLDRTQAIESSDLVEKKIVSPLEGSETGAQRVVQRRRHLWKVDADYNFQIFYTSDLFLSDEEISEYDGVGIMANSLEFSILPIEIVLIGHVLTPSIGASWKRLNHFGDGTVNLSGFDFEQHRLFSELRVRRPGSAASFAIGLEYSRLYDFNDGDETYTAMSPWMSLNRVFQLGAIPLIANADMRYHDADKKTALAGYNLLGPDSEDRLELSANIYSVFSRGRFRAIPFLKLGYISYAKWPGSSRTDLVTALGTNLSYGVSDLVSLRSFFVYEEKTVRETSLNWPGYQKYDLGAGLSVFFQF